VKLAKKNLGRWRWTLLFFLTCIVASGFAKTWYQRQILLLERSCRALEAEELRLERRLAMANARAGQLYAPAQMQNFLPKDMSLPPANRLLHVSLGKSRQALPREALSAFGTLRPPVATAAVSLD
jgi:hypothetical protein